MRMFLKRLVLTNFKGIRSFDLNFSDSTFIYGQNGTGKTTVSDAFYWLLFEKNSQDQKDFEIKTLDENNQPYHRLDHEVAGWFEVDGQEVVLRKSMREKWTKPRGQKDEVFAGHETAYFWNEVPVKKSEYQDRIADLLDEGTFKMITNPLYFNQQLKWQERRSMLITIAGNPSNADVVEAMAKLSTKAEIEVLINGLNQYKTADDYRKVIKSKINTIKGELEQYPSRIDEAKRSLPDPVDYDAIMIEAEALESKLADIDKELTDASQWEKIRQQENAKLLQKKGDLNRELLDIEFAEKEKVRAGQQQRLSAINAVKTEISSIGPQIDSATSSLRRLESDKAKLQAELETLRNLWKKVNAEALQFNGADFCCPTCNRAFEEGDIEAKKQTLTANFNKNKSEKLEANVARGKAIGVEISDLDVKIAQAQADIKAAQERVNNLQATLTGLEQENIALTKGEHQEVVNAIAAHTGYAKIKAEIASIDETVNAPSADDKTPLLNRKSELQQRYNQLQSQLATKSQKERAEARIAELLNQEEKSNQELAELEGMDYKIEQFIKVKMNMVEDRVNGLFSMVRFKMFEDQINGGQAETCVALINGVPFSDANTASKINAGLDVINTLSKHFGAFAPIFIDNRESVTDLIDTESQVVSLVVKEGVRKLKVVTGAEAVTA